MKKKTSSIAKITRPKIGAAFQRKRLYKLLDGARNVPIIFVSSPAGSGKTTLVSSYLEARKLPYLWYRIDEGDSDIASFFYYMSMAVKNLSNKKWRPLPEFTPEYVRNFPVFTKRYFEDLFGRLSTPFVIVMDNYQNVPNISLFHEMISYGLATIPDGITVILISRKEPPPSLVYFMANDRLQTIMWDNLRFTIEETKGLILMKKRIKVADSILSLLQKKTDGWAAGIILLSEKLKEKSSFTQALNTIPQIDIFNYFANEIFKTIDQETQYFLLKTSFFPRLTWHMGEKISGSKTSNQILEQLFENNYFTMKYPEKDPLYQYHPLFRDFLMSLAEDTFGLSEANRLKKAAADVMEEALHIEDSIELRIQTRDFMGLKHILVQQAQNIVDQGRTKTLFEWLNLFPYDLLIQEPWLLYWKGVCLLPNDQEESLTYFQEAFHRFQTQRDASGIFLSWSGIAESLMYGQEGLKSLDSLFMVLNSLLDEYKVFPSEKIEILVTCSVLRSFSLRKSHNFNINKWLNRLQILLKNCSDYKIRIRALVNLAAYHFSIGDMQALKSNLESLTELTKHVQISPLGLLNLYWMQTAYYNSISQYDRCREAISHGLALVDKTKISILEPILLGHAVLVSLKIGDHASARYYLEKMAASLSFMKSWQASFYHCAAGWEALYRNDHAQALFHSEQCLMLSEAVGNPWPLSLSHILKSYVSDAFGDNKNTFAHINEAQIIGYKSGNTFSQFITHIMKAYFLMKKGLDKQMLNELRKGLKLGEEKGYVNLYICIPGILEAVVTKALEHGIAVQYAQELIRKNSLLPKKPGYALKNWPWPFRIYTLGRFSILRDEKPLFFSGKIQRKPLVLLKALIAFGGEEISEALLTDTIWPDADGVAAHSAFTTTLSRLRKLLGDEHAIQCHDGKVTLDSRYCWLDVWAFEQMTSQVEALWEKRRQTKDSDKCIEIAENVFEMYTGAFLSGDDEPWLISTRERLRNKSLRNLRRLGQYYEQAGKVPKAMEWYEKGIEVDNLAEEFYQQLMKCCQKMGKRAEGLAVYRRCYNTLHSVLGIEPSHETDAIMRSLRN